MPASRFVIRTHVEGSISCFTLGNTLMLDARNDSESVNGEILYSCRITRFLEPCLLLVVDVRTIEHSRIEGKQSPTFGIKKVIPYLKAYISHISHLLGNKATVCKELIGRISVCINRKRHALLTNSKSERVIW